MVALKGMISLRKTHWICFGLLLVSQFFTQFASARGEQMGEFSFSEISLSPRAVVREPSQGGFTLEESWLSIDWRRDENLRGEISFGTSDLIRPALFYTPTTDQISLVEAFLEARTQWVDVRAGLLPIATSYENSVPEWEWYLPATRVRERAWFTRRDIGVQLEVRKRPYLTQLSIYNGEGSANLDKKIWYSGLWSYQDGKGWGATLTASVGKTSRESTDPGTGANAAATEGFVFDPLKASQIRYANLAVFKKWLRSIVLAEYGRGDVEQDDTKNPFQWGHFDVSYNLGGDLNLLARFEQSQSDLKRAETRVNSTSLGFTVSSSDRLSSVTFIGTSNKEKVEVPSDELHLIFRLNSNVLGL